MVKRYDHEKIRALRHLPAREIAVHVGCTVKTVWRTTAENEQAKIDHRLKVHLNFRRCQ